MGYESRQMVTLRGEGPGARDAVQSLLGAFLSVAADGPDGASDLATVVSASASTLEAVTLELVDAMLAARDDLDIGLTGATLDGLMATDDGWRAWGTVNGRLRRDRAAQRQWQAENAVVQRTREGTMVASLTLEEGSGNG